MKKVIKSISVSMVLLFMVLFNENYYIKAEANEITDEIYNNWEYYNNGYYGYICPEVNENIEDILLYCHSIVDDKKGRLYDNAVTVPLIFEYTGFASPESFSVYVEEEILYPLMAAYPDTSYSAAATVKNITGQYSDGTYVYYAWIIFTVNGNENFAVADSYNISETEQAKLSAMLYQLANEAKKYSSSKKNQLEYIFNYLRATVNYGAKNMKAYTAYGALFDKLAVCQGYSMVIQDVCYILNIPCILNYSNSDVHGWNIVFVDGKWNFIDATNGHFMNYEEDEISDKLNLHHFDKEMISMVQNSIINFNITGDVDNDKEITAQDALLVLNIVVGMNSAEDLNVFECADTDKDGVITSNDALLILECVVGIDNIT